jgi:hypothetical protein
MRQEEHTIITLEELLRGVGPRGVVFALARVCERIATEDAQAVWPAWLQAADVLIEMSSLLPDTSRARADWHRAYVS